MTQVSSSHSATVIALRPMGTILFYKLRLNILKFLFVHNRNFIIIIIIFETGSYAAQGWPWTHYAA